MKRVRKVVSIVCVLAMVLACSAFASAEPAIDSEVDTAATEAGIKSTEVDTQVPIQEPFEGTFIMPTDEIQTSVISYSDSDVDEEIDGTKVFDTARISHIVMDQVAITNGDSSWASSFRTTDTDPAYRVWIHNTGSEPIQIYVKKDNPSTGQIQVGPVTIPAGESRTYDRTTDNANNNPGIRWVIINPIRGGEIRAEVRVRIAPSMTELG